ncbi:MAG: putative topoisomerase [Rariglobus sp.]|jgi:DNA topoisomerase-1|nr:putative topoisomerase [Rariglobus sp.]
MSSSAVRRKRSGNQVPSHTRPSAPHPPQVIEAQNAADEAGLRYVTDQTPGIIRRPRGKGFVYIDADGRRVTDHETLARIRSLAIPPAWRDVWICPQARGHLQATGRDARGRKQHRYHPAWRETRDSAKFSRTIAFGRALPRIRRRVARDLRRPGLGREKVLATMVRLLETTLIRIGNEEYLKHNRSVGLSTMRDRHVSVKRGVLHFNFKGKSGKQFQIDLEDPRLARIVRRTQELPGQELFQYLDEDGVNQKISSTDVNAYLREIGGEEFSAKDFRTWAGTVLAALALRECEPFESPAQARRNLVAAIENVARRLGNTPAICRKCYIHPVIMDSYLDGKTIEVLKARASAVLQAPRSGLSAEEKAVLAFLRGRLRSPGRPA